MGYGCDRITEIAQRVARRTAQLIIHVRERSLLLAAYKMTADVHTPSHANRQLGNCGRRSSVELQVVSCRSQPHGRAISPASPLRELIGSRYEPRAALTFFVPSVSSVIMGQNWTFLI